MSDGAHRGAIRNGVSATGVFTRSVDRRVHVAHDPRRADGNPALLEEGQGRITDFRQPHAAESAARKRRQSFLPFLGLPALMRRYETYSGGLFTVALRS